MDFDGAINAHAQWKMKLSGYIRKPDKSLKPEVVAQDNQCELGKWIHGEGGAKFSALPEFSKLKSEHARFHRAAAEVVRKADSGVSVSDEVALGANSEYASASSAVTQCIMTMRRKAG